MANVRTKKVVCLEEIGSSVYDPKHYGMIKDMITNPVQSFNRKYQSQEETYNPTGFIQITNDIFCVKVSDDGVRRVYLVKVNPYWSEKQCKLSGRVDERAKKFASLYKNIYGDKNGCLTAFAHYLYTYPLRKDGNKFVKLEHYNIPCKALHEQQMMSLSIHAQMVALWLEGEHVWIERNDCGGCNTPPYTESTYHGLILSEIWVPRSSIYSTYLRRHRGRQQPDQPTKFWMTLKRYIDYKDGGKRDDRRGVLLPCKNEVLRKFQQTVPNFIVPPAVQ